MASEYLANYGVSAAAANVSRRTLRFFFPLAAAIVMQTVVYRRRRYR